MSSEGVTCPERAGGVIIIFWIMALKNITLLMNECSKISFSEDLNKWTEDTTPINFLNSQHFKLININSSLWELRFSLT